MNLLRQYFTFAVIGAASMALQAKPSVLSLADHVNDSTIIYPESVETDVHKMMQNWYLETYTALDKEADYRPDVGKAVTSYNVFTPFGNELRHFFIHILSVFKF